MRGFTMVEILVALVIGIISMAVVLQTFSASESTKRTTTGGDDAQVAGALSLFDLERDMTSAGYGISTTGTLGCQMKLNATGGNKIITIAPVIINPPATLIPAGDTNTDTLLIMYGNSSGAAEGDLILTQGTTPQYNMQSQTGWSVGDYVTVLPLPPSLPSSAPTCASSTAILDTIKTAPGSTGALVVVNTGVAGVGGSAYTLFDLGPAPVVVGYRVFNAALTACNYMKADCSNTANWTEVSSNIVSMHAVYGHSSSSGSGTSTWDQTTPSATNTCAWVNTTAVAVALVARNTTAINSTAINSSNGSVAAGSAVTTSAPKWQEPIWGNGSTLTWQSSAATYIPMDLSANNGIPSSMVSAGVTWQNYRYRLYSTVVPLRNITTLGKVQGCP